MAKKNVSVGEGAINFMKLRKTKPKKASMIGPQKGQWRRVEGGWKRRKFSAKQRHIFRARRQPSTQGNGPR